MLYIDTHHVVERRDRIRMEVLQVGVVRENVLAQRRDDGGNVLDEFLLDYQLVAVALRLIVVAEECVHCGLRPKAAPTQVVLSFGWEGTARVDCRLIADRIIKPGETDHVPLVSIDDSSLLQRRKHHGWWVVPNIDVDADLL